MEIDLMQLFKQYYKVISGFVFLLLVFSACQVVDAPKPTPSANPTFVVKPTFIPPTASPTRTEYPPTATYPVPTATIPPTPFPTLSIQEKEKKVRELISTNNGCSLPCIWGITPGETKKVEVDSLLGQFGQTSPYRSTDNDIWVKIAGPVRDDKSIDFHLAYLEKNDVVEGIEFYSDGLYAPDIFQEIYKNYSPQNIFLQLGLPDRVFIIAANQGAPRVGYEILLCYDKIGLMLDYSGITENLGTLHFCPTFPDKKEIDTIRIYAQNPSNQEPLENLRNLPDFSQNFFSFEEKTGISIEKLFKNLSNGNNPCFDTPVDIWPRYGAG